MTGLDLRGVSKVYSGGIRALAPVDLTVRRGEFVVLVGPSGCGKSTLLRLIAGLEEPSAGEILLDGQSILNLPPAERDVAMVFQSYALYPHMSVAENIEFGLRMRKVPRPKREQAVRETAALLGLADLLERRPGQLSGGQRQRVALGRAIVRHPRLFLFDEPLSNLDAALRTSTRAELRRLHAQLGATILYVTHDQVEAMSLADRLVVMQGGTVQQVGSPIEVYEHPANQFVAGFIGAPPMNFLRTRRRDRDVIAGLRAEHFDLVDRPESIAWSATPLMTELLGNETLVTCVLADGQQIVVRLPGSRAPQAGVPITLRPDWNRAVFFDPATGAALSPQPFASDPSHQITLQERE